MNKEKRRYIFKDGKELILGDKMVVMGILNVTPDSFSDGGHWDTAGTAADHTKRMCRDGAGIIDMGAESTRPGSTPLTADQEWERLQTFLPVVLKESTVPVSVDTYHYENADRVMTAGAHVMNDIWGLQGDDGSMARVAAEHACPVIVMHNEKNPHYHQVIEDMKRFFDTSITIADKAGIRRENIILDPGIGFAKTRVEDLEVIRHLDELTEVFPFPFLLAASRKRIVGTLLSLDRAADRDEGTGALSIWGLEKGCAMVRVHNMSMNVRLVRMWEALKGND